MLPEIFSPAPVASLPPFTLTQALPLEDAEHHQHPLKATGAGGYSAFRGKTFRWWIHMCVFSHTHTQKKGAFLIMPNVECYFLNLRMLC